MPGREGGTTAALEGIVSPQTLHSILNTLKCTLDNLKCMLYLHHCSPNTSTFTLQKALNLRLDRVIPLKYGKLILGLGYLLRNLIAEKRASVRATQHLNGSSCEKYIVLLIKAHKICILVAFSLFFWTITLLKTYCILKQRPRVQGFDTT